MLKSLKMTTIEEGLAILADTIRYKGTHKNYDRVTELCTLYKQLITGHNIEPLLKRFVRREDAEMFRQRVTMTQVITPAVAASIMNPFYKVPRVNSIIEKIDFEDTTNFDEKKTNIEEALAKFNGDKSLKEWMESRFVEISFTDPNAFIITEFDAVPLGAQGEMLEMVQPRPFEVSCYDAINYKYKNNILQWLVIKQGCKYEIDGVQKDCYSYTIYLDNDAIKFVQIDPKSTSISIGYYKSSFVNTDGKVSERLFYGVSENEVYQAITYNYKAGSVPARRVGYKNDLVTNGETFVNPFHDALPYFLKSIKAVSEFDLTMALHAFPQKLQYSPRCRGVSETITCHSGYAPDGNLCGQCHGSGVMPIHTTAQDAVMMVMPKDPKDIVDLQSMIHYESPPIDIVRFQNEYIFQLKNEVRQAVFNSEIFSQSDLMRTATELRISLDAVYDTLFPFASAYSSMYKHIVRVSASFRDINDIIVEYRFPKDFKFKTVPELLSELKQANDSSAPGYVRQEITSDIVEQQFVDKPIEIKKIKTKQLFFPFPDKGQTEIIFILSNNLTSEFNKVLWANFDNIFSELERDAETSNLYFYDIPFEKQKELLDTKVGELIADIEPEQAQVFGQEEGGIVDETQDQDN